MTNKLDAERLILHPLNGEVRETGEVAFWGCRCKTVACDVAPPAFAFTFEDAYRRLQDCADVYIEPDGSFGLSGRDKEGGLWTICGQLHDRGEVLHYIELLTTGERPDLAKVLAMLQLPPDSTLVQLPSVGVYCVAESLIR